MEAAGYNTVMRAFGKSYEQFKNNPTTENLLSLNLNLEELYVMISNPKDGLNVFNLNRLNTASNVDIISSLRALFHSPSSVLVTVECVAKIFQHLATNSDLLVAFQRKYNVHLSVAVYLKSHALSSLPILNCFAALTENININYVESHLSSLITKLLNEKEMQDVTLSIVANLTLNNRVVQEFICGLPSLKKYVSTLIERLSYTSSCSVIDAVSVLVSLSVFDPGIQKMINKRVVLSTLHMMMTVLQSISDKRVDIALIRFKYICENPNVFQLYIENQKEVNIVIDKVCQLCQQNHNTDEKLSRYFHFLVPFTNHAKTTEIICNKMFILPNEIGLNESPLDSLRLASPPIVRCVLDLRINSGCALHAAKILKSIIQADLLTSRHKTFLVMLCESLSSMKKVYDFESRHMDIQLATQLALIDLLHLMSTEDRFQNQVLQYFNVKSYSEIIFNLLDKISFSNEQKNRSELATDLVFQILLLLKCLKKDSEILDTFHSILNDSKLVKVFSFCFNSSCATRISKAVDLAQFLEETKFREILVDNFVALNNLNKGSKLNEGVKDNSTYVQKFHAKDKAFEKKIESIIERWEKSGEKDLKVSDLLSIHKYKIDAAAIREEGLQNLLNVKTRTLEQSDFLLNQHLCQQADADIKFAKYQKLIIEWEIEKEKAEERLAHCQQQCDELQRSFAAFKAQSEEEKIVHEKKTQDIISEFQDKLKEQQERFNEEKREMQKSIDEKQEMQKNIDEINRINADLEENLQKSEDHLKKLLIDLELEKDKLAQQIEVGEKLQLKNKELAQELKLSQMLCKKHESSLEGNFKRIKQLTDDLEKQKEVTDMIHRITGQLPLNSK